MKYIIFLFIALLAGCSPKEPAAPRNMVVVGTADVYRTAGDNPDKWVYALGDGDTVQVYEQNNQWSQIGEGYWVHSDKLQPVEEDPAGAVVFVSVEMTPWVVCVDEAKVYSNPGENEDWYLYSLHRGDPVTVRELDRGTRTFAAIKVANYTRFTNLCQAED